MRRSHLLMFGFVAFCGMTIPGLAQPTLDARSTAYMWSPAIQQRLHEFSLDLDKNLLGKPEVCRGNFLIQPLKVGVLQPLSFPGNDIHADRGAWLLRYRFHRCDESITYNALFQANGHKPVIITALPPGTTLADPRLAVDLHRAASTAAILRNPTDPQCRLAAIVDTALTRNPAPFKVGDETLEGVWEELWTVRTCAGTFSLSFCLVPEKRGGTTWSQGACDTDKIGTARTLNRR